MSLGAAGGSAPPHGILGAGARRPRSERRRALAARELGDPADDGASTAPARTAARAKSSKQDVGRRAAPVGAAARRAVDMSESESEHPPELENQFILRLPLEQASAVRSIVHSRRANMRNKIKIDISPGERHGTVQVEDVSLSAKLVDLPCVIESLKTVDKKSFYKTSDISQMLVCSAVAGAQSSRKSTSSSNVNVTEVSGERTGKEYVWKHGITPPLKNVRKRRFRKVIQKSADSASNEDISLTEGEQSQLRNSPLPIESSHVNKEVSRLLCSDAEVKKLLHSDAEAISTRWEICDDDGGDDDAKETDSGSCTSSLAVSSVMSISKQDPVSSDTQKQIQCKEKLFEDKAQSQKSVVRKEENVILKSHLSTVLENLMIQEKQKSEQEQLEPSQKD